MADCAHCLCGYVLCACPQPLQIDDPIKPVYRSPIDCLGYPYKCCCCIPLKAGVSVICFISFVWALVELSRSGRTMATIFPNKDNVLKSAKMIHIVVITAYLVSCGLLMVGIIRNKFKLINIYVWAALIFNCISIVVVFVSLSSQIIRTGGMTKRTAMLLTLAVFWYSLFFYYISVVNSYKYRVYGENILH